MLKKYSFFFKAGTIKVSSLFNNSLLTYFIYAILNEGASKSYHSSRADTALTFYLSGSKSSTCVVVSSSVHCLCFKIETKNV